MPTYENLACWCAAYNVALTRDCAYVRATAYDMSNHPISTCTRLRKVEALPTQEDDFKYALDACDDLAEELLILKPSVAAKLNL
jgi:hypothetical protein